MTLTHKNEGLRPDAALGSRFGLLAVIGVAVSLASCGATDVIARYAASSFAAASASAEASAEASATVEDAPDAGMKDGALRLVAPGGEVFSLASDLSAPVDSTLSFSAQPFLAAGLDPSRLPTGPQEAWSIEGERLVGRFDLAGSGASASADPADYIRAVSSAARKRVGYHAPMKHYGVMLGDSAMVEWAADLAKNDKDLVFVLDPGFLRAAGVDVAAVSGWVLADVPVARPDGAMTTAEKLLKAYDLE